jgi:LmbE family N-acetylglucosaminyl deacetylase
VKSQTAVLQHPALVFAPHQDDETLGCGGTLLQKTAVGATVQMVFMTDGRSSHAHLMPADELAALRTQEATHAAEKLGIPSQNVHFLGFTDGMLHTVLDEARAAVLSLLQTHQPTQVFVPYYQEPPSDHVATHTAVLAALGDYETAVTVYEYPIWYWYHWPWVKFPQKSRSASRDILENSIHTRLGSRLMHDFQYRVDVSDMLEQKRVALAEHQSQMEQLLPDPRWLTLHDVADGDFLSCFFQKMEIFHCYHYVNGMKELDVCSS